jgi:RNA polymerase sigma factor (sigma-70 family)
MPTVSVFLSYRYSDLNEDRVRVLQGLARYGVDVWFDRPEPRTAAEWEKSVFGRLRECEWFMLMMSSRAAQSPWVRREVDWAMTNRFPDRFLPVLLERCDVAAFHPRLCQSRVIDFRKGPASFLGEVLAALGLKEPRKGVVGDLVAFLAGRGDPEADARICRELDNPDSRVSTLVEAIRMVSLNAFVKEQLGGAAGYGSASDTQLMDRVRDLNDRRALEELYRRHARNRVIARAVNPVLKGHPDLRNDALQLAWLKLWQHRRSWQPHEDHPGAFLAWLAAIARRAAIDIRRRECRTGFALAGDEGALPDHEDPHAAALEQGMVCVELAEVLIEALRRRREKERAILLCRYFDFPDESRRRELVEQLGERPGAPPQGLAALMCSGINEPSRPLADVARESGGNLAGVCRVCRDYLADVSRALMGSGEEAASG